MKFRRLVPFMLTLTLLTAIPGNAEIFAEEFSEQETNDIQMFRPVDCGIQAQKLYEYPFLGLTFSLPETIQEMLDSREIFAFTQEDYAGENIISYGVMRFSATTKEQREEEGMSVDIFSWEAALEKVGAIVVCQKELSEQLDELTGCDTHEKLGESADKQYEYYLSTNSKGDQELVALLKETEASISEMHELDMNLGYTAFAEDRVENTASVGEFTTEDVFGETYTQDVFAAYDLTLVNIFATWCSPCVQEMPELEALRKEYEENDLKLGIVGIVLDTRTESGIDEGAVERAKTLYERSGVQFPFLIPDDTEMNGRLTGIASVPESFFVNSEGEIVSEPYIGARAKEDWAEIVEQEGKNLEGNVS